MASKLGEHNFVRSLFRLSLSLSGGAGGTPVPPLWGRSGAFGCFSECFWLVLVLLVGLRSLWPPCFLGAVLGPGGPPGSGPGLA